MENATLPQTDFVKTQKGGGRCMCITDSQFRESGLYTVLGQLSITAKFGAVTPVVVVPSYYYHVTPFKYLYVLLFRPLTDSTLPPP